MELENLNPTEQELSGGQEGAVDLPENENRNGDAGDGQESAVDSRQDGASEDSGAGEGAENSDGAGQGRGQSREENAAVRAARLRERAEAERRERARADEEIASAGIINPYTGVAFKTLEEFKEYGKRYNADRIAEEAKKTGKTVEELTEEQENKAFVAKMRKQEQERTKQAENEQKRLDFAIKDVKQFQAAHPQVDVGKLIENKTFLRFAGSRYGVEPLSALYEDYCEIVGDAGRAAVLKSESKAGRSTGSAGGGADSLTAAQRNALAEWNAANPDMQMTAKEFLKR